jgi:hypothetical protein
MAYKFQLGPGRVSGSLAVVGDISSSLSGAGVTSNISASGDLRGGGLRLSRLTGSSTFDAVGSDQILFASSEAGQVDGITPTAYGSVLAGTVTATGLAASAGVLSLDIDNLAAEVIATGDTIVFNDDGDNGLHKETVDDLFKLGPALVSEAVYDPSEDYVLFLDGGSTGPASKESAGDFATALAGPGLAATGGALELDLNELDDAVAVVADKLAFVDGTDDSSKLESITDLATLMAGTVTTTGIAASSGVFALDIANMTAAAIASTDTLVFNDQNGDVLRQETIDDVATLFAGDGLSAASAVMALDLNELTAAVIDVANDSFAIIDATDSGSKKESIDDFMEAIAGTGITNTNGVLSVDTSGGDSMTSTAVIDNSTLTAGMNYFTGTIDPSLEWIEVSLPASPTAGDLCYLKAPSNCGTGNRVNVEVSGSHKIDGLTQVILQDPYASVGFVYAATNSWTII